MMDFEDMITLVLVMVISVSLFVGLVLVGNSVNKVKVCVEHFGFPVNDTVHWEFFGDVCCLYDEEGIPVSYSCKLVEETR